MRDGSLVIPVIEVGPSATLTLETVHIPDSPCSLPFRIEGFNSNFLVAYLLNGDSGWRFMGHEAPYHYFNLYTDLQANKVVAGHPLTADDPEVEIALNDPRGEYRVFEVYNPTDRPKKVKLASNTAFLPAWSAEIELGAHESKNVTVTK